MKVPQRMGNIIRSANDLHPICSPGSRGNEISCWFRRFPDVQTTGSTRTALLMKMESLTDLLIEGLQEAYDAERQLSEVLPTMSEVAFSEELREALSLHAEQTRVQLKRVEDLLSELQATPIGGEPAEGMRGIIAEAERLIAEAHQADPAVFDAALIAVAQRAEHYEIAVYGTLGTYAQILGVTEALEPLRLTLNEELETDRKLTALAETAVNLDAAEADQGLQEEAVREAEEGSACRKKTIIR
jgi:ferritin-like metal-binding protein YciE